jgi:hypothetical protein
VLKISLTLSDLRAFTILMAVAFRSRVAYLGSQPLSALPFNGPPCGWMANPIIDSERWFGLDLFCAFQYVYLMHLMFLLSGLFVWPSLVRKGGRTFLYNRIGFAASSTTRCFALVALFLRFAVRRPMRSNLSENAYGI